MRQFTITESADQQFSVVLNGKRVTLRLWYNRMNDRWSLDIYDKNQPVLLGRRIVSGIDLIEPYGLGLGSIFAVGDVLGRDAFTSGKLALYHATPAEIAAAVNA